MRHISSLLGTTFLGLMLLVVLSACATIPKEAPELSMEMGNRIAALEQAHLNLLHRFFDEKRKDVDAFILEEWVPEFAAEFFADPAIERIWLEIVRTDSKQDRLEFIVHLGPKLQTRINSKRLELIQPLDEAERLVERTLREEYQQARAINNSLTSFLVSAAKVDENRRRYLDMAGVSDQRIAEVIDSVDDGVGTLLDKAQQAAGKEEKARKYLDKIMSAVNKLKS